MFCSALLPYDLTKNMYLYVYTPLKNAKKLAGSKERLQYQRRPLFYMFRYPCQLWKTCQHTWKNQFDPLYKLQFSYGCSNRIPSCQDTSVPQGMEQLQDPGPVHRCPDLLSRKASVHLGSTSQQSKLLSEIENQIILPCTVLFSHRSFHPFYWCY